MFKKYILPGGVAAMVCCSGFDAASAVVINEIMQSNIDCVYVDHEYPDSWIELYNSGTGVVDLSGWRVGVKEKLSSCYELPAGTSLAAGGYMLVYCDKSDAGGLHTTFRLESGKGGAVYLYDAEGRLADSLTGMKKMPAPGVAYGRTVDGGSEWRYMVTATPGGSNSDTAGTCKSGDDVHPSPLFSHDSFVSVAGNDAFTLTVSVPAGAADGAVLCVTTDGREPQLADAVEGREWNLPVDATTVVRARLLGGGRLPVRSDVRSYIYLAEPNDMRVVSLVGDPDDFYDEARGIYSGKPFSYELTDFDFAFSNWNYKWRRPVNVEYFSAVEHRPMVNQLGETRIHGGWTRCYDQKSLTVYANKRFGTKRYDTSDFWPDKPGVDKAQSFVIRNGGNMFLTTRINDALAQILIARGNSAVDWQAYSPCIYYLNGRYMGIGDLRERSNEDYVASNYTDEAGDELEDIDMIENWNEVKAGSMDALDEFQQWYNRTDVTLDGLRERMDVDNFIDQLIIHWFGGNRDFFNNNIVCWRPTADGGRWRWLLKDIDLFANTLDLEMSQTGDYYDYAEKMYEANPERHRLFRLFYAELPEARDLFIDRMLVCMGDMLQPASVKSLVESLVEEIIGEYPRHLARYFTPERAARLMDADYIGAFPGGTRFMANDWAVSRSMRMYSMLQSRYSLGDRVYMKVNRGDCTAPVSLQGYTLTQPRFSGQWFTGREIRLAVGPGYGIQVYGDGKFIGEYAGSLAMLPPAGVNSLDFFIVSKDSSGVECIEADADSEATVEYYTLQGVRMCNPEPGLYIRRQGSTASKVWIR